LKRCLGVAATALTLTLGLGGCGLLGAGTAEGSPVTRTDGTTTPPAASAKSGFGSVKDAGDLPDPCTLLSRSEVEGLTDREVAQIDEDGAEAGEATRYCQWQQTGGQLAVFLTRTTDDDFSAQIDGADPVDGVGEDAFALAGHLYVLYGTVQIDVYSHGGTEDENLAVEKQVATTLLPRV
jgi:hypothetical protein